MNSATFHQSQQGGGVVYHVVRRVNQNYLVPPNVAAHYKFLCFKLLVYQRTFVSKMMEPVAKETAKTVRVF
jgi:hypothetical protein